MQYRTYEEAVAHGLGKVWRETMGGVASMKAPRERESADPAQTRTPGIMNKTETRFSLVLHRMFEAKQIVSWEYEAVKLRIAERCWLTPDFRLVLNDFTTIFVEVKGAFIREDSWVKLKAVAELHPYGFFVAQWQNGRWTITRMPSRRWGELEIEIDWGL